MQHSLRTKPPAFSAPETCEPPIARPIEGTMAHYGWTRTFIFQRLAAGDLEAVKAGRRTTITTESAQRLYRSLPRARYGAASGRAGA